MRAEPATLVVDNSDKGRAQGPGSLASKEGQQCNSPRQTRCEGRGGIHCSLWLLSVCSWFLCLP